MQRPFKWHRFLLLASTVALLLSGCMVVTPSIVPAATPSPQSGTPSLATARASAQLSNQPGRAIVTARGNHFVVDSVPPLGGPNEERNPLDMMLAALATCGTFVFETAAQEMSIPLEDITTIVEADFDPRGLRDGSVNPRVQVFRVHFDLSGPTPAQSEALVAAWQARCPVYNTLSAAAPITITQ